MIQKERKKHEFIEKCEICCRVYSYFIPSEIFLTQVFRSRREDSPFVIYVWSDTDHQTLIRSEICEIFAKIFSSRNAFNCRVFEKSSVTPSLIMQSLRNQEFANSRR